MREDLLKRHLELVIEANKTTNITRISTWMKGCFSTCRIL